MPTSHEQLADFIGRHPRLLVLTGAGISADSGIPTYRDESGRWLYRKPIQHHDFLSDEYTRKRYWARSLTGWPSVQAARPNPAHRALAQLESAGTVELLLTQNVDRLHQRAGSRRVVDLHGRLDRVLCLGCSWITQRDAIQDWLEEHNGPVVDSAEARPDGDSELPEADVRDFRIPACPRCDGTLIPDVVFFGGSVPKARVDSGLNALQRADALLVVGSSLQVYSGYRFCRKAVDQGKPIAILNRGRTRADDLATLKVDRTASEVLQDIVSFPGI